MDFEALTAPYARDPGERETLPWLGGARVQIVVDAAASAGRMSVLTITADEGYAAAAHRHDAEDELFYVLSGAMTAEVGDRRRELTAGGVILLPRGLWHRYRVEADGTELLNVCTPGGLDGFFREVSHELTGVTAGSELAALVASIGGRYGLSYVD